MNRRVVPSAPLVSHMMNDMGEEGGGYRVTARGTSFPL